MKFPILSLLPFALVVTAIPAPQWGGNRHHPGDGATRASTPAAAINSAPAVSTRASAPAVASEPATRSVEDGSGAAGTTPAGGDAATVPAGGAATTRAETAGGTGASATGSTGSNGGSTAGNGHKVTVNNNCGSGSVQWQYGGHGQTTFPGGSTTINGPISAAIMWLDKYNGFKCQANAVDCAMVEFTLGDNGHNAINYSLLMAGLGNHVLRAPMFIELTGGTCSAKAGGPCTGMTVAECPNGYTGTDTQTGPPVDCAGTGVGATITFCP